MKRPAFILSFVVAVCLAVWVPNAGAFMDFGANGTMNNCQQCHAGVFGAGDTQAHTDHMAGVPGSCGACHGGFPAVLGGAGAGTIGCNGCHIGPGLRNHHRGVFGDAICAPCHGNVPEAADPENTPIAAYAMITPNPLDPCNGSEERFDSFTISLDNDGDGLTDGDDPDCAPPPECTVDADCDDGDPCTTDTCESGSCSNVGCPPGQVCGDTGCMAGPECTMDSDCGPTDACVQNTCDANGNCQQTTTQCAPGEICDPIDGCISAPMNEICDDGMDNDGDGRVDCDDPDCAQDRACEDPKDKDKEVMYSPDSELGAAHISMYNNFGTVCTVCHDGVGLPAAPNIAKMKKVDMDGNKPCVTCHQGDKAPLLFISLMNNREPAYARCEDCHAVKKNDDGKDHDGKEDDRSKDD